MGYTSRDAARAEIAGLREFKGNSLWGTRSTSHSGQIYGRAAELWRADITAGEVSYVVVSYATPIAWYTKRGAWVVPDEKYSHTTSRHQSVVRQAVR
jgi:hypothetical protein